jgi:hypothetical protein
MSQETDPRHEQLIAALYGELSGEEEKAFHRRLLTDAELRADWEELRGTRTLLGEWTLDEAPSPSFVFLNREGASAGPGPGGWLRVRLRGPALGLAAAAALAVLVLAGFRMDRVNGGVVFRFGPPPTPVPLVVDGGKSLNVVPGESAAARPAGFPAEAGLESPAVLRAVSAMLSDYQEQRNAELAYILRGMVDEMRQERAREMDELKARVDVVGLLMAEQNRSNAQIRNIIDRDHGTQNPAPLNQDEDN